jgi:hypothetical protein
VCISPDDLKHSTSSIPSTSETTYLGYYSSTGVLPGSTVSSTFTYTAFSATPSFSEFSTATAIGGTRTFNFSPFSGGRQASATTTINITIPGGPIATTTVQVPAAPGTISFSIPFVQTSASFGVSSFTGTQFTSAGGTGSSVQTRSMLSASATNEFNLGRSAPDGSALSFSAGNATFGNNNNLTAVDFNAIKPWSRYTFQLYNAAGALISTETDRLSVQPRPSQALRTMPLHDMSPSHAMLTPAQAAAASLDFKWTNNIAAPTPYQVFLNSNLYDGSTITPSGTVRRNSASLLKRQQLSTSGEAVKNFAAAGISQFTGCRVPSGNASVAERLDTARTINTVNPTVSNPIIYTNRSVRMYTSINRTRVGQTTAWEN